MLCTAQQPTHKKTVALEEALRKRFEVSCGRNPAAAAGSVMD
ncbi:hypothetical protein [Polaromonas sp. CG9_12]|nr:hypothetical protein [Polaromonas sp. CG9_12]